MPKSIKLLSVVVFCVCVLYAAALFAISAPSGVRGYVGTEVHFSWGESSGEVDGYRIYWGDAEGGPYPNRLCDVNGSEQNHTTSLNRGQTYHLVCRAYNEYGESGNSNEVKWPERN